MIILFWSSMIAAIIFSIYALMKKKPLFLVISFVLIIPFSLYLVGTPLFRWWGMVLPFFYLGSAFALKKNILWLSIVLLVPVIFIIGRLGYIVMTQ